MGLVDGLSQHTWEGETLYAYKLSENEHLGLVSLPWGTVQDITKFANVTEDGKGNKIKVNAVLNCHYFDMSGGTNGFLGRCQSFTYNGTTIGYGEDGFEGWNGTNDKPYTDLVVLHDGTIKYGDFNSWDYTDVMLGVAPAGVELDGGENKNWYSPAVGYSKITTANTQSLLIKLDDGRFGLVAVSGKLSPITCREWTLSVGGVHQSCYDSGGSTQLVVNDEKVVYTGRAIPTAFVAYEIIDDETETPDTGDTDTGDGGTDTGGTTYMNLLDKTGLSYFWSKCKNAFASKTHTHNYAGSSSAGGSANSAVKLDSSAGSATQPVYFSGGKPVATTYTLAKSVPSDAKFTDTTYSGAGTSLGLVKSGGGVTISDGVITVNDDSHNHVISNVDGLQSALDAKVPTSRTVNGKALSANITLSASDVGADASGSASGALAEAKTYTDTSISELIDSAPSTLDTLGEIATAMEENADVVEALENAIGNKANASDLTSHTNNKSNPHSVTKSQVGLGNVPNVTTNNQTPTYSVASTLATLVSGETLSVSMGKIMKAITDLISHLANTSNPHSVTKSQVGLGNVENKSSSTIRGELTKENVTDALGYTPPTTNTTYSVATTSANGLMSSTDKSKLDGIATGANKTVVNNTLTSTSTSEALSAYQGKVLNDKINSINTNMEELGAGDMLKSVYDTDGDGIVDNAEKVNGHTVASDVPANAKFTDTVYTHPTTSGNKHIPSGGSSGQILRWSADGTAVWGADNNTTYSDATTSTAGLMSASDKSKLDGITAGANKYTHPSYTARTGVPTANQTPEFGGTFSVTQPVSDASGHITGMNSRTITIPSATATTSKAGLMSASDKSKLDGLGEAKVVEYSYLYTTTSASQSSIPVDSSLNFDSTVDTLNVFVNGFKIPASEWTLSGSNVVLTYPPENAGTEIELVNKKTMNGISGSSYSVDSELNASSVNAVQNKAVYDAVNSIVTYKESTSSSSPIVLRSLASGMYKIYGYFTYYSGSSTTSSVDPFAYVIVEKYDSFSYVTVITASGVNRYNITDSSYEDIDDSGWITATLTSSFNPYSSVSSNTPQYRKKNGMVSVRGGVSPSSELTAGSTEVAMFTLPSEYRPSKKVFRVCQGSDRNVWLLSINTNGSVCLSRYGNTTSANVGTSAWLVFDEVFMVG